MFEEAGIDVPVDRAHRTGQGYTNSKTKQSCKSIIIRFTTFRHRTRVYRAKKILKKELKFNFTLPEEDTSSFKMQIVWLRIMKR